MTQPHDTTVTRSAEPISNDLLMARSREKAARLVAADADLARSLPSQEALDQLAACPSNIEFVAKAFALYSDRPCFGVGVAESASPPTRKTGALPHPAGFTTLSYADVWSRIEAAASGLKRAGLAGPGELVGICGFGNIDWVVTDLACLYLGAVSVPLQTSLNPTDLQRIVHEAALGCLVVDAEQVERMEAILPQCPSVHGLVVMDSQEDPAGIEGLAIRKERLERDGRVSVFTLSEIERRGREEGILPFVLPSEIGDGDPLMTLMYTSGSTGTPKGAMLPESVWRRQWRTLHGDRFLPETPHVGMNYMPLNHAAGRLQINQAIARGGVIYFTRKSDMSTLFADIRVVRPTQLMLVPRVASMVYQELQTDLAKRVALLEPDDHEGRARAEAELLSAARSTFLGDRLLMIVTGTASTPPEVAEFMKRCFEVPVIDMYGTTEAGLVTFNHKVNTDTVISFKLIDVPDLGYYESDRPYPRGELHVDTNAHVPGYYKNEKATRELFDDEGFINTGDIVEQRDPTTLVVIDRAKNVLKLAQGEFVATARLEGIYAAGSPLIRQIYLYGNGHRSYLLAVVVPSEEEVMARLPKRKEGETSAEQSREARKLVREELQRIARQEELQAFEIPRDFLLESEPFTQDNGLLTESNKPARSKLRARYGERLEELYAELEHAQLTELFRLREGGPSKSVAEKVAGALSVTLGVGNIDKGDGESSEETFLELGGDSLAAVQLNLLLEELTGINVPVGLLLDPTTPIHAIVRYIESGLTATRPRVTFESVHGKDARVWRARDLRVEAFLAPEELEAGRGAKPASELPEEPRVVLLTGANGFLGRFLALELLERLPKPGGKLVTVVRAQSDAQALERLASSYRTDPALERRFRALAEGGRLEALAGDLMKPKFGLTDDVYARLEQEVDVIVHNGALVNHALGYPQLFEPNVLGTVEVLRLALGKRVKAISYLSTIGVLSGLERPGSVREDDDVRVLFPERQSSTDYANGYSTTKWASEVLLRDAHEKLKVPVTVFRPSGIMAHSVFRGQVNGPDFLSRLLGGIVITGLAPISFASAAGEPQHYDGLPVEVVARSITGLTLRRTAVEGGWDSYATYHVVNPHDDSASLDRMIDWVQSAGYRLERVRDYVAWFRSFRERLLLLGDAEKQHSPLAILDAWAPETRGRERGFQSSRLLESLDKLAAIEDDETLDDLPCVSERFVHKYLNDMNALGLIPAPPIPKPPERSRPAAQGAIHRA